MSTLRSDQAKPAAPATSGGLGTPSGRSATGVESGTDVAPRTLFRRLNACA